ncbi:MAG: hypothetical protein ACLSDX_15190 [Parabacteroides merdae]
MNALQPFSLRKGVKARQEKYRSAKRKDDFSPPTRRARPCAPEGNGYLCFKEISVSFSAFYRLQLSSCGEKECLTVTRVVRFAVCSCFFVSFAQETVGTA